MEETPNTDAPQGNQLDTKDQPEIKAAATCRRSARLTDRATNGAAPSNSSSKSPSAMSEPRRNPKRKASEAANNLNNLPENLLDEGLAPLSIQDIENWEGWIELESEPAFFNIILRDLGVQNVKAQEIFSIDQDSLDLLPKPVFGLIFLFQWIPGMDEPDEDEDANEVWFANQTTDNACATVALLNIVMNVDKIELGDNLREFKASTKDLCTALRGHQLSRNTFIRKIHNSFTRRMDHLNADLALENEVDDAKTKQAKKRAPPKSARAPARRKKPKADYGFHFIAYVPAGGHVWELDGLRKKPHKLGPVPEGDWTTVAQPQIERRMLQYEESQLSFNLLALCQSPLAAHSLSIASAVASLDFVDAQIDDQTFKELVSADSKPLDIENVRQLSEFSLTKQDIEIAQVPLPLIERISQPEFDSAKAYELHQELVIDVKAAMGEYRAELMAIAEDEQRVKGRKKDYGPALHKWVKKLAEKGVLEDVIRNTARE